MDRDARGDTTFLDDYGSTPDEIISGLLADNEAADKLAREWAERAAQPGATPQVKKAAEDAQLRAQRNRDLNFGTLARYRELAETEEGRIVARVQELAGESVDIFDRDFDEDDFYREAMRAVRAADETASADVGDMTTPEGQAQAMAHLTDFSIVSEKGGEIRDFSRVGSVCSGGGGGTHLHLYDNASFNTGHRVRIWTS